MYLYTGSPLRGAMLERLQAFLHACALDYDAGIDFSCLLMEDDEIIAAASLDGCTVKCVAVSPEHQGENLTARLLTELRREALNRGLDHLMLFTKPANQMRFQPFGFYPVARAADCLLMEDRKNGLKDYLAALGVPASGINAAVVGNFNPFTRGHRYLIETAAAQCDHLHVFVLSEKKSAFPPEVRMKLAQIGCADLKNISFHYTGPYLVSSATFPDYFIRDKAKIGKIHCELDTRIFAEKIAPALGITRRFLGTEPNCPVTRFYNEEMKRLLPEYGVQVIEIPRLNAGEAAVSASRVRSLLRDKRLNDIRPLVPETTFKYLLDSYEQEEIHGLP